MPLVIDCVLRSLLPRFEERIEQGATKDEDEQHKPPRDTGAPVSSASGLRPWRVVITVQVFPYSSCLPGRVVSGGKGHNGYLDAWLPSVTQVLHQVRCLRGL